MTTTDSLRDFSLPHAVSPDLLGRFRGAIGKHFNRIDEGVSWDVTGTHVDFCVGPTTLTAANDVAEKTKPVIERWNRKSNPPPKPTPRPKAERFVLGMRGKFATYQPAVIFEAGEPIALLMRVPTQGSLEDLRKSAIESIRNSVADAERLVGLLNAGYKVANG